MVKSLQLQLAPQKARNLKVIQNSASGSSSDKSKLKAIVEIS